MNKTGTTIRNLFLCSPIIMGVFKLFGWDPFASMPWHWVTSPWWYLMLIFTTTCFVYGTIKSLNGLDVKEESPRKDLH